MKQLFFLLLFPCLALAQYTGNAGQKITLGEQTTADGLVYRGVAADTTRKPSVDTMAYILLDTNTNIIWQYKKATNNAWTRVGGSISSGVTGVLPVENGGTGSSTQNFVDLTTTQSSIAGAKTFTSAVTATRFNPTASTVTGTGMFAPTSTSLGFSTSGTNRMNISDIGNVGIGVTPAAWASSEKAIQLPNDFVFAGGPNVGALFGINAYFESGEYKYLASGQAAILQTTKGGAFWFRHAPTGVAGNTATFVTSAYIDGIGNMILGNSISPTEKLHVEGNARITGAYSVTTGSAANVFVTTDGVLQRSTSSIKYKTDVEDYSKGLKEVMQLRPVTFKSINSNNDKTYAGFIAEELADLKLNELVENNDSGEPDAISYAYMVTLLTKAIQEQQEQISLLKKRLLILENK